MRAPFLTTSRPALRGLSYLLVAALLVPMTGCGGEEDAYDPNSLGVRRYGAPAPTTVATEEAVESVDDGGFTPPVVAKEPKADAGKGQPKPRNNRRKPKAGKYKVDTSVLANAGSINGVVKFDKQPTPLPKVATNKDNPHCGEAESPSQRMIFDAEKLTVANAVVYLEEIKAGKNWEGVLAEKLPYYEIDQKLCQYIPHITVVKPKTSLSVSNSDNIVHNIHGYFNSKASDQFNFFTPANAKKIRDNKGTELKKVGRYLLHCDIHPWMNAVIHVIPHPYFAVTGIDGTFEIKDVPPGKYRLICWKGGMKEVASFSAGAISGYDYGPDLEIVKEIEVTAGGAVTQDFEIPAP